MVIQFYNLFSSFTPGEWYTYFYSSKKKNSKQKRLLQDCFQHFVLNYPFLDETQQWGKVYQFLGIPNTCGKVDKVKLKKIYAVEKRENGRISKLKVQIKPRKNKKNNDTGEKDQESLNLADRRIKEQQSQIQNKSEPQPKSSSIAIDSNSQQIDKRQITNDKQINHDVSFILNHVYKSEISTKKRVRFKNVQILCFDKSISSESEISTSSLLNSDTTKQRANNKSEKIIHTPYFERLNDSVTSESNADNEGNRVDLTPLSNGLREDESQILLNKGRPGSENNKEPTTIGTHSNESDIAKLLEILSEENDDRILSANQSDGEDTEIYSSIGSEIRIISPFHPDYEEDCSLSSDSLMNDYDTGVMSPCCPSEDDGIEIILNKKEPNIREQIDKVENENKENIDKISNNQTKSKTILEIRNSTSEEINTNVMESSNEKISSTSDEGSMSNLENLFNDQINFSEKDVSKMNCDHIGRNHNKLLSSDKKINEEGNHSSSRNVLQYISSTQKRNTFKQKADKIQKFNNSMDVSNDDSLDKSASPLLSESEKEIAAISPLSSESSVAEHFIHLTPLGKLMSPIIGNMENLRLNNFASFSHESSENQQEFGFSSVTISKSSVLAIDHEKEQTLSYDSSFNTDQIKENVKLVSKNSKEREKSPGNIKELSSNEKFLNDSNKENRNEINQERNENRKDFPVIISNSETTTTGSSENIVQSSLSSDFVNKREPLKLINNAIPKLTNSSQIKKNILRNRGCLDKENVAPVLSDHIFPSKSPKRNISKGTPTKDSVISESSSYEVNKCSDLVEETCHGEEILASSFDSKISTDNDSIVFSDNEDSLSSDLNTGKYYKNIFQKLKESTVENPMIDKGKLTLSSSKIEEASEEMGLINQIIDISSGSEVLSETPKDVSKKGERENIQGKPNITERMNETRINKDVCSENTSQNFGRSAEITTKQALIYKTAPTTINSSDSWSGKEYLLRNFTECISKVRENEKQILSKKISGVKREPDFSFETLDCKDINYAGNRSRESIVRKINSVLNDSSLSSSELIETDEEEKEQLNENSCSIGECSTQPDNIGHVTDIGVNAYFNHPLKISLSSNSIDGSPVYHNNRSCTVSQQISNDLIFPDSISNFTSQLIFDTEELDNMRCSVDSNDDVEMKNIDVNNRGSAVRLNVSNIMEHEEEMDTVGPFNKYKRKVSSTGKKIEPLNLDHDADSSSSDSCEVLSQKKIKRRRKKATKVVVKLKHVPCKHNNKYQTSSDDNEFIKELSEKKKLRPTLKKTTITNTMLINVINEIEEEKTLKDEEQQIEQISAAVDNQSVNNASVDGVVSVQHDSNNGQRISQELKLRKSSIVKQQINSSDTSTTSEFISSALARRIFYIN